MASKSVEIRILPLNIEKVSVTIEGISPLLVHKFSEKSIKMMEDKQQKATKTKKHDTRSPEDDFNQARYLIDGKDCFKALAIKAAMVRAGTLCGIPMTDSRQLFFINNTDGSEFVEIISDPPIMRTDTVRVGNGSTDLRYRPEYHNWKMILGVEFDAENITLEQVLNLLNRAGSLVGIGEWRPKGNSSSGNHGRFRVLTE